MSLPSFEEDISQPTSVAHKWEKEQFPARHQSPILSIAGLGCAWKRTGRLSDPTQNDTKTQMTHWLLAFNHPQSKTFPDLNLNKIILQKSLIQLFKSDSG